jgi:hypothetical protein
VAAGKVARRVDRALRRKLRDDPDQVQIIAKRLGGEVSQGDGFIDQPARLENAAFAVVEHAQRIGQSGAAILQLLALGKDRFLVVAIVDQPVLPFAGIAFLSREGSARRQPEVYPLGTGFIPLTWSRLWGVPAIPGICRSPWALAACISRAARPALLLATKDCSAMFKSA